VDFLCLSNAPCLLPSVIRNIASDDSLSMGNEFIEDPCLVQKRNRSSSRRRKLRVAVRHFCGCHDDARYGTINTKGARAKQCKKMQIAEFGLITRFYWISPFLIIWSHSIR
jgi:hypothetical protein